MKTVATKWIVGLGNPGMTYNRTRHNVGFMLVDRLARRWSISLNQRNLDPVEKRPAAVWGEHHKDGGLVRLLMPLAMMNDSGAALRGIAGEAADILVVCDDVNLPLGHLRMRPQGGPGGHNGLESCITALGTESLPRLRIGVGAPPTPADLRNYVLSAFSAAERPVLDAALDSAADACESWATEGIERAMNRFNSKTAESGKE